MSVFTTVTPDDMATWLQRYTLGTLTGLRGIAAGIENTNYFLDTTEGRYVLTLFEKLRAEELPFYLDLMSHLAARGIPCPAPVADRHQTALGTLNGKPASIVTRLPGTPVTAPVVAHCRIIGALLARMHLAVADFPGKLINPRGPQWWHQVSPLVLPFLDATRQGLLRSELVFQAGLPRQLLPQGAVHADLFRDNVLWDEPGDLEHNGTTPPRLGGVIDFYFAGVDSFLYDLAVTVNDWCVEADGALDAARADALVAAYRAVRPLNTLELECWPGMLRAGALRFWLSRLHDFHLPRAGELTHAHDPEHFFRVLRLRRSSSHCLT
jgi:homoserine kinase type II